MRCQCQLVRVSVSLSNDLNGPLFISPFPNTKILVSNAPHNRCETSAELQMSREHVRFVRNCSFRKQTKRLQRQLKALLYVAKNSEKISDFKSCRNGFSTVFSWAWHVERGSLVGCAEPGPCKFYNAWAYSILTRRTLLATSNLKPP